MIDCSNEYFDSLHLQDIDFWHGEYLEMLRDGLIPTPTADPEVTQEIIDGWLRVQSYGCELTPYQIRKMLEFHSRKEALH